MRDHCISHLSGWQRITGGGRGKVGVRLQPCEQPGDGNVQATRKTEQHQHGNIALPQFDLADIRGTYAHAGGEGAMGELPLLPVLTEDGPKALQRGVLWAWRARWCLAVGHRRIPSFLRVPGPQDGQRRYGREGGLVVRSMSASYGITGRTGPQRVCPEGEHVSSLSPEVCTCRPLHLWGTRAPTTG